MTARFQMNRRKSPIRNKLEYIRLGGMHRFKWMQLSHFCLHSCGTFTRRQGCGILAENIPPQLNVGLEKASCQFA